MAGWFELPGSAGTEHCRWLGGVTWKPTGGCFFFICQQKKGEGRNRTRKLYPSEPNTLCFKGYCSPILQGFKLFFRPHVHCPLIARLPLFHRSSGETLGEELACHVRSFVAQYATEVEVITSFILPIKAKSVN